jgi:Ca2+:H+ antiporter
VGLIVPAVFCKALTSSELNPTNDPTLFDIQTLKISRATAVILLFSYAIYNFFQTKSHDGLYSYALEADKHKDADLHKAMAKDKLNFTECRFALVVAIA